MKFQIKVGSIDVTNAKIDIRKVTIDAESEKKHATLLGLAIVAAVFVVLGIFAVAAYGAVSGDYVPLDKIIDFLSTAVDAVKEILDRKYESS